ncbi:hypothetical protein B6U84_01990 [Candidatus Bathyarchaeota archaeon ex4484_40]|nr:MAG: hypothetical protein B6U84_01990 [Candidatus Bathyarchaeota archaeon ex4484_40]
MIYLYLGVFAAAWAAAYLVIRTLYKERLEKLKSLKLYPLAFVLKSEKLVKILDRVAASSPLFWRTISNIGLAVGFGLMGFAVFFLTKNIWVYLFAPKQVGVQNIVIPLIIGVTIRFEHLPYMLLALAAVLITHEGMHGLVARLEKIKLKSTGVFLAFIFPGGFVEPDEEEFKKAPPRAKARVAAAGSFANVVVGVLVILLMMGVFMPVESGVIVLEAEEGSSFKAGETIFSVNGVAVNRYTLMENITAEDTLTVRTSLQNHTFKLREPINMPIAWVLRSLGVVRIDYYYPMRVGLGDPAAEYSVYRTFWWTQLIALGVAIFNMLPIQILDGYLLLTSLLEAKIRSEKKLKLLGYTVSAAAIALLLSNIAFTYKTFGFFQL